MTTTAPPSISTRDRWGLAVILAATFMGQVDGFVVTVAAPTVQTRLPATFAEVQLIGASYVLAAGGGLVVGGRLGDRFGRRQVFMIAVAVFGLASLACGLAPSAGVLVAARVVQGFAAAALIPQQLALIREMFDDDRLLARAISVYGVAMGLGVIAGIAGGGALVQADLLGLSWRAIFLINVPITFLILVAAPATIRAVTPAAVSMLDLPGAGLTFVTFVAILLPVVLAGESGNSGWIWLSIPVGMTTAWSLVLRQRQIEARGGDPLFPRAATSGPGVRRRLSVFVTFFAGNSGLFLTFTYYTQGPLGHDPLAAGLMFAPLGVGFILGSVVGGAGRLLGEWSPTTGCLGVAVLLAALMAVTQAPIAVQTVLLAIAMALLGLAMGFIVPPLTNQVMRDVHVRSAGAVAGVVATLTQFGLAAGYTGVGAIFRTAVGGSFGDDAGSSGPDAVHGFVVALIVLMTLALFSAALCAPTPPRGRWRLH